MERHIKAATQAVSLTRRVGRVFRSRLALTTVLTVVPFIGYGRQAFAACDPTDPSTYICSGDSGRQTITADNATVTTVAGFSVYTDAGSGIVITGDGQLTFIDTNASSIRSTDSAGLAVISTGNDEMSGGVTIETNGNIRGATYGIYTRNYGNGDLSVTADGAVEGENSDGIHARNDGNDLTITAGEGSVISGRDEGIEAFNEGIGELTVTAEGEVAGRNYGLLAVNRGSNLEITVGAQGAIAGGDTGIIADNQGDGDLDVNVYGQVTGEGYSGLYARNEGTNLTITTGVGSVIIGKGLAYREYDEGPGHGIDARNYGEGNLAITVNGRVEGEDGDGIFAGNGNWDSNDGADLTVTTGAQSKVTGSDDGIDAENNGRGKLEITVNGTVIGTRNSGIEAENSDSGTSLKITTNVGSVVEGDDDGIDAEQYGDGDLTIVIYGRVTGSSDYGIDSENYGTGDTRIVIGASGLVEGAGSAIDAYSDDGQDISIINDGLVRNLSGRSDYLAIETDGGETEITNNGNLIGIVNLGIGGESGQFNDDRLDNAGFWNTAGGANLFGGGDDVVTNSGTLLAANDATQVERTRLFGLERSPIPTA
ncbi:hypothetical protein G5V57_06015 [Nordella sp. HKS 07]|uniref:hypothetical protein n=1 Tax=Nordella sp. HKS 07 TaxID=2712222 RepID=UPI0013E12A84|nr:hypothetical protein [Nordella sp. HKS 07]QIG47328.1 hypothetical protein G5V57_06015 [Nordella sp. HKS 07]